MREGDRRTNSFSLKPYATQPTSGHTRAHTNFLKPPDARPSRASAAYQWCSARRSSRDCIHTCRPCRCRARCSGGDTPSGHTRRPSSPRRSGSCLTHKHRGHHSRLHKSLWERQKRRERKGRGSDGGGMGGVMGQGDRGEEKTNPRRYCQRRGRHAPLPCLTAAEKKFLHLMRGQSFFSPFFSTIQI